MIRAKPEYARALSAAFAADMERNPDLQLALAGGRLDRDGLVRLMERRPDRFPNTRAFAETVRRVGRRSLEYGLGQWEALGGVFSSLIGAASKVYGAKVESDLQKKLASLELQKQQAAIRTAEIQAQAARLQYAKAEAAAAGAPPGAIAPPKEAEPSAPLGIPWLGWLIGLAGAGGIGYLVLRPRTRGRR